MEPEPFDPGAFKELAGAVPWVRRVACFQEIDSTNAEALRQAAAGEPHGLVVVADAQTAGRGRLGRAWWSEPGASLLTSWLARPLIPAEQWPLLSLAAGVAAARALGAASGLEVRLKWPNDLMVGGRKIAGILAESDGRGALVVGLGVNVRQTSFPDEVAATATSIVHAGGRTPARAWLLSATLSGYGARMTAPSDALGEYRALCDTLGRRIRVERAHADPLEGTALDVTSSGALLVEATASTVVVPAGDVVHLRDAE